MNRTKPAHKAARRRQRHAQDQAEPRGWQALQWEQRPSTWLAKLARDAAVVLQPDADDSEEER
jgi:hypothetical protein